MDRYRVFGLAQPFFQIDQTTGIFIVKVAGGPPAVQIEIPVTWFDGLLNIVNGITWRESIERDGRSIYKWLEGRTHLPTDSSMVVLEIFGIDAAYPGFDVSAAGFHCQNTGLQKHAVVFNGIQWRHYGVFFKIFPWFIGENLHPHRATKIPFDHLLQTPPLGEQFGKILMIHHLAVLGRQIYAYNLLLYQLI